MAGQDPTKVKQLVESLDAASKRRGKGKHYFSCRKSTFEVAGSDNIIVDSWKFQDWDYKRNDLPTYARGLFTTTLKDGTHEIAIRGYDKFFNVDEVASTDWMNIEANTRGPYELSVKENGCIIFISGLEDGTLLVCSKHSTGAREDVEMSHSQAGEMWIKRHVASMGKSVKDLASELRQMNATAVGELCDDSFEEHVLAYDAASSGIYLHGLNFNVPEFVTLPSSDVHAFAARWGLKCASFVEYNNVKSVRGFLEQCAETGTWNGRETEGFVIRCQMSKGETGSYRNWFFKYKFEEPYLMYRQWRECTKAIIANKHPKIRKHHKVTEEYLLYARRQLAKNPEVGRLYNQNHGIIAMREGFLKERGLKGPEIIAMEAKSHMQEITKNVILVPVASLGCGKTTIALALTRLFGWGHVQNDNIPKQKNKPKRFAYEVVRQLADHPVVIADRNNHQMRERKQIMDDVRPILYDARFIGLHYVHEPKEELLPAIRAVTRKRVLDRGDNHQTIKSGTKSAEDISGIIEGFLHRFDGVDTSRSPDDGFDEVIDLDATADSRQNLETVVRALHSSYPRLVGRMPTSQELDDAVRSAMNDYHVELDLSRNNESKQDKKKPGRNGGQTPETLAKHIEYFSISIPTQEISSLLGSLFPSTAPQERTETYRRLISSHRIQPSFHITLVHRAVKKDFPQIWSHYAERYIRRAKETPSSREGNGTPVIATVRVRLERVVWDHRIMAFVTRIIPSDAGATAATAAAEDEPWPCANHVPHVTVGTVAPEVKPKESNDLLMRWLEIGSGGETGIWEAEIPDVKIVQGTLQAVMARK